jgi:large subunit ribosomal protein L15
MPKKRVKKIRGSKTCGGGGKKKRRGKGSRGGVGRAGSHKHHYIREILMGRRFGKKGFSRPLVVVESFREINVGELEENLEELIKAGYASREGDAVTVNLTSAGFDKLLGKGKVTSPINVKVGYATSRAITKIEEAGGKVEIV